MGYLVYEGKTRQEALDKMKLAAIQEGRLEQTRFIKTTTTEIKKWFGLKKEVKYNAIAYVEKHHVQKIEKPHTAKKSLENNQPTLFNEETTKKAPDFPTPSTLKSNSYAKAISEKNFDLENKVETLENTVNQLQHLIKNELNVLREGLIQNSRNQSLDSDNKMIQDIEIGKQNILWAEDFLRQREFDLTVIGDISAYLKEQKSDVLIDKAQILTTIRDFLKRNIPTEEISLDAYDFGKNILVVGPTGVGKTVNLVKMAAHIAGARQKSLRFISIDRYKLGADAQLKMWADLMQSECVAINEQREFFDLLERNDTVYTFIDTAGKSPRETIVIKELKDWIQKSYKKFDIHLVISATTKPKDLDLIIENYGMVDFNHIIATKLDETVCLGSILSILYKTKKTLSFISNGQQVPMDFEIANVDKLIADSLK